MQNDPVKTVCATMFIVAAVQAGVKIGDLSHQAGQPFSSDAPGEEMALDEQFVSVPEGVERGAPALSREEERALVRDSTAGFAGKFKSVPSLFILMK
jgi:proteasome activator subunit 4